jgi:aryl-phospho-beta-D-glucosidase BglC (GH1 family)
MLKPIIRAALAVLILVAAMPASSLPTYAEPQLFPDVPAEASFAEAVRELSSRGIVRGYADGRFGPQDPLLRAQTAVTLVRAMGLTGSPGTRNFSDQGEIDDESWAAVRILADRDVARGYPDGTFMPADELTRQQAISFISRMMVALGRWQAERAVSLFDDVAPDHRADVATYVRYVGGIPGVATTTKLLDAEVVASRGWYAETLWAAVRVILEASIPTPSSSPEPSTPPTATPTPAPVARYQRGVNLAGAEFGERALPGVCDQHYTYPTAAELDYYKAKGLTLVRLPFRWERLQRSLYAPLDADELARLDAVVAAARARGLGVILDPHNYARYHGALIGTEAVPNAAFADFWQRVALHYRDETAIWAYGLMNEPHDTGGRWPAAAQAGVSAIRTVDMTHTILVPGDGWSGAWRWDEHNADLWVTDPADKLLYEAHQYFDRNGSGAYAGGYDGEGAYPAIGVDRLRPFTDWLRARNARGFIGEYGVPDSDPRWLVVLDQFLTAMDAAGLSGTYWAGGPWWGDYHLAVEPRNGQDRPQMPILVQHPSR